jgi:hypothetical protein
MRRPSPSPRCRALRFARTLPLLALLTLASCHGLVSKPVLVQRAPPGPDLTDCPEETAPAAYPFPDEVARYTWAEGAIFEGRICREVLRKAKDWMLHPPKEALP